MTVSSKISIVIPAYKAGAFIKECLDSIECQTFFKQNNHYEIIVGVDGCEETLAAMEKIRKDYRNVRLFLMRSNMGVYITLNTLFSLAEGDNIIVFGADDVMKKNMVERVAAYMETNDIIRYYCQWFVDRIENTSDITMPHGSVFVKREVFQRLGGFKPWVCGADTDFLNRAAGLFSEKRIIEALFYYRKHNASLTQDPLTGRNSAFRKKLSRQISHKFEYIKPVINDYDEVI